MDIITENNKRVELLNKKSHNWLMSCAYNFCKDKQMAEELVSDLYLYILDKPNPAIWYNDTFNLLYLYSFIKSRWINQIKVINKTTQLSEHWESEEEVYNEDLDKSIDKAYVEIINELDNLKKTKMWASAKIAEMYFFTEFTLEGLANEIGISKSTSFLNTRKIKRHLREVIENPFNKN